MAACGSLQHLFENPLTESPTTLVESPYSWSQIKSVKPVEQSSSFTEIFGELHFKDKSSSLSSCLLPPMAPSSSSSPSSSSCLTNLEPIINIQEEEKNKSSPSSISMEDSFSSLTKTKYGFSSFHRSSCDSFSSLMNSESLQLCTEGLGFESSGEVEEDLMTTEDKDKDKDKDDDNDCQLQQKLTSSVTTTATTSCPNDHHLSFQNLNLCGELKRSSRSAIHVNGSSSSLSSSSSGSGTGRFPPPISCISKNGKPWVCFKSYRHDDRFVLKQIRIPTQEFLHACREDGRLKLHFVHPHHHYRGILEDPEGQQYNHDEDDDEDDDVGGDDDDDHHHHQ